ncbi:hypothetical protein AGR8A_Lc10307 [Agrobacterium fabrum str. J-07]|nr:hypothetical protein AGR8A_Lc10307 [Agrobacterium fabrum str. J-07]
MVSADVNIVRIFYSEMIEYT